MSMGFRKLLLRSMLVMVAGCGGQVVVDPGTGPNDDVARAVCEEYCELARGAPDGCGRYNPCMDKCLFDLGIAEEEGCLDEMIAIMRCHRDAFKKTGFCQGECFDEFGAKRECRDRNGY